MKKVLILSYYWPPAGGPGVQRWIRFCKSLPTHDWEPVVYVPKNARYLFVDESLKEQVAFVRTLKKSIFEPHSLFSFLTQSKKQEEKQGYRINSEKTSIKNKIGWFIRGNLFIPDARCGWIKPSVKYLNNILKEEKFDVIVSTGPPHSMHIIASALKRMHGIPWVADFRDPWTSMGYYREMPLTAMANRIHKKLEKKCVLEPDEVIVVTNTIKKEWEEQYGRTVEVIHNGYDDLIEYKKKIEPDKKFTIVYIGTFLPRRNCDELWRVLAKLIALNERFKNSLEIKLIGNIHETIIQSIHENGLSDMLNHIGYLSFLDTQKHLFSAQLLLLTISKMDHAEYAIPGKLFEYLKSERPLLLIGPPNGDSAAIIKHCNVGYTAGFNDEVAIEKIIMKCFEQYLNNTNTVQPKHINDFSGTHLTKKLAGILDHVK